MSQKKILVVDDSDFDRSLLVKAIQRKGGYEFLEAKSGEEALALISTESVGLVLLDFLMPFMSGSEVLVELRKKYNAIELPIIMVTAKADASDVISCLQNGANDYITKPVNFEVALTRISTHLRISELSGEMVRLRELSSIGAMVATYNHEINNPLAIALGLLNYPDLNDPKLKVKLEAALWRVADIVKKIKAATEKNRVEYEHYAGDVKTVKVR